jgi:hypothetical protein
LPATQEKRRAELAARGFDGARVARELGTALERAGFDLAPFQPALDHLARPRAPLALAEAGPELAFLVRAHVHELPGGRRLVASYVTPVPDRLDEAIAALEAFARAHAGSGQVAGMPILEQTLRRVVVRDTARVTAVSVGVVVLLLALYYRRLRPVVAVVGPLSVAWVGFGALLGAAAIPLNLFNLLAVPLVIGYGIDDHVFLVHRHLEERDAGPERALASTGRAIVVTSLSTMAGFAGLAAARFDGLRQLGVSGAGAVGLCLIAAMAVLPALLALLWPRPGRAPLETEPGSAQE